MQMTLNWYQVSDINTYLIKKDKPGNCLCFGLLESGRQGSKLRPSAPKALNSPSEALGFQSKATFFA